MNDPRKIGRAPDKKNGPKIWLPTILTQTLTF